MSSLQSYTANFSLVNILYSINCPSILLILKTQFQKKNCQLNLAAFSFDKQYTRLDNVFLTDNDQKHAHMICGNLK